ncbi:MAG: aminotransferase DegT [Bdellovibrionales bacterium CG12_big_fil_rev_8_21_14_0_65_38_15]|nr:MAG: aminotransferase DegT [Bdellovibrionales bacterium CG22_combo_CG10-13_8_21_14_all_38_13]PIQ56537.1 MAG: aminotransferase DegT [Bdellovibrionales bacterium CG12_big_fil_rev_8_21_14_0_65_38_15]PIR30918.1 MAG: aminotransferase DegT [Bdellovibrionales bacterium CG11_big_fil_rev_8_21_14_0_20_38_13]
MEFIDLKTQYDSIHEDITHQINKVLSHGQYIMGPEIGELESELSRFINSTHCITNSSGTDALLLALMAIGIRPGDEVITTPFTFFATGEMISLLGAKIVLVDIDNETYNLDARLLESAITSKTKAIMPVSLYGLCADFDPINEIANKYKIPVIEDAAQSFGASYKNKKSCGLSTIGCTSFFPSKPLGGYGDGGACFTNDPALALKMRELRIHGQESRYNHTSIGINGRLDTLQAGILLAKFKIFPKEIELRKKIGARYTQLLDGRLKTQKIPSEQTCVYAQYTIEVENRSDVQEKLKNVGVPTSVHYPIPLHLQPVFKGIGYNQGDFPNAENASKRVMSLPMHPYLDEVTQDKIVSELLKVL